MKDFLTAESLEARRITDKIISRIGGMFTLAELTWKKVESEITAAIASEIKDAKMSRELAIDKREREIERLRAVMQEIARITPSTNHSHSLAVTALDGGATLDRGRYELHLEAK